MWNCKMLNDKNVAKLFFEENVKFMQKIWVRIWITNCGFLNDAFSMQKRNVWTHIANKNLTRFECEVICNNCCLHIRKTKHRFWIRFETANKWVKTSYLTGHGVK